MKLVELERILAEMGFSLIRLSKHRIWGNGPKRVALPHDKQVNRMMARRVLKEIGYTERVEAIQYG